MEGVDLLAYEGYPLEESRLSAKIVDNLLRQILHEITEAGVANDGQLPHLPLLDARNIHKNIVQSSQNLFPSQR